ncbi:nif11 domain/cupin domain protein [Sedimentisphaera cyanobacteriorum]|uniref:Nif11 domain/cupin domain protein n=1 Tax=Sedimentisphaera cyanobacteriorum TaxID=1940790 RepID=A0A1Q2HRR0_9BACT|nr:cupin domain-containing protein [Sedimentisphaera cyanobacteriorum]AQQ10149.1 nif11 domain/cupin domain protein [Sedimentisphaera cyanobacteriorum]
MQPENIFENLPEDFPEGEQFDQLCSKAGVTIERIISQGHKTAEGKWLCSEKNEWVFVLKGEGVLEFQHAGQVRLKRGDYCFIPAGSRHRVADTSHEEKTIWLAIHF